MFVKIQAASMLGGALAILFLTVWSLEPRSTVQANLPPWPDAPEYLDGALHLARQGDFRIHVAGRELPPRYPFGFSMLTAALLRAGVAPLDAPYQLNKWAGLLLLVSTFAVLAWRGHLRAAGLAALLLSTRTSFIALTRAPLSEAVSILPVFWGAVLLYHYAGQGRRWAGAAGALLIGLSPCFRLSSVLLLGLVPAALAVRCGWKRAAWLNEGWRLVLGAAVALSPLLIYHWLTFGAPWKTGYGLWLGPAADDPLFMFGPRHLGRNLSAFWEELTQSETTYTVANLFGNGSYLAPAYGLLCLLSLWLYRKHRPALGLAAAGAVFAGLMMFYEFGESRMLYPVLVLSVPLAALSWTRLWASLISASLWGRAVAALGLLLAVLVGWPGSHAGTDMGGMLDTRPLHREAFAYQAVQKVNSISTAEKLILSEMDPPFVHAFSGEGTWAAPLQEEHGYSFSPERFTFSATDRRALVEEALASGREVYAACNRFPIERVEEVFPAPNGRRWTILWRNSAGGGAAQLVEAHFH